MERGEITLLHRIEGPAVGLGVVRVEGVEAGPAPNALARELDAWVARRGDGPLPPEQEQLRLASRDMLRNGRYKPTGRGKPASEYLLRAAARGELPRINGPVDANNLVSLQHCVPISVWDLDRAGTRQFELRLGRPGERYVFNAAGQLLELQDLVCGCGLQGTGSTPLVTPIKDSLATKLTERTRSVAGCIYYPLQAGSAQQLARITEQLLRWLQVCGAPARGAAGLLLPGGQLSL